MKRVIFLLLSLWVPWTAGAVPDPYLIKGMEVELGPGNPEVRREQAVERATKDGFSKLLRNLTSRNVWERHDEVVQKVDWQQVLSHFTIRSEKTGETYRLKVDLAYNADYIRRLLTSYRLPYSEVAPLEALVLPLLELPPRRLLWEETNPWKQALADVLERGRHSLADFTLPLGDYQEMSMLTAEMVSFGASDMIVATADNYDLPRVLLAQAVVHENGEGKRWVEVTGKWYGDAVDMEDLYLEVPFPPDSGFEDVLAVAARRLVADVEEDWRSATLIKVDRPGKIFLLYNPQSAADLERFKAQLLGLPLIRHVKTKFLSRKDSVFLIDFYGDLNDLREELAVMHYDLTAKGRLWRVVPADEAAVSAESKTEVVAP